MKWLRPAREAHNELYNRLQWFLFLRVVVVTFLLGATAVVHIRQTSSFTTIPLLALYLLIGVTYFFTLISLLLLRFLRGLRGIAYLQVIWEVIFITGLIYVTAGIESIFSFLYLLAVITASILLYRPGAYLCASLASLCYGGLLFSMDQGWIPPLVAVHRAVEITELTWNVFINITAFLGVALLSGILTDQLRAASHELKEIQEDLDQVEALNDSIVMSIASGLITLNQENKITSFNKAAARITGLEPEHAVGKNLEQVFPGLDPAALIKEMASNDPGPGTVTFKMPYDNRRGETLLLEVIISSLFNPAGQAVGWLMIFSDITRLKEMEDRLRQADRLAAVGQLAAGIAHEIRNPLAAISGSLQMLRHEPDLDSTATQLMTIALRETDRLNQLITEFLIFARPTPRVSERIVLADLIQDIIRVFLHSQQISAKINVTTDLEPDITMESDPQLIKQILWNLVNNAAEAMPQGGNLSLRARTLETAAADDQRILELKVEDTGVGIPQENLSRIFDPFFTTKERGTGLGLSTVYRIVEAMAGDISVESQLGRGSSFIIRIPLRQPQAEGRGD